MKGDPTELAEPIYDSVDVDVHGELIQKYSRGVVDEHHDELESPQGDYMLSQGFEAENVQN